MATAGNFGLYLSVFAGMIFDRYGPRPSLLLGALFTGLGFFGLYACTSGMVGGGVGLLQLFSFCSQHGAAAYGVSGLKKHNNDNGCRHHFSGSVNWEIENAPSDNIGKDQK